MMMHKGMVHIYTGEGKGKTTAALGLGLRAWGCGFKVCMFQFLKGQRHPCSEQAAIEGLGKGFRLRRFDITHPIFEEVSEEKLSKLSESLKKALLKVNEIIKSGKYEVIVMDEILNAVSQDFVEEDLVLDIIRAKPKGVELVLTGRGATKRLIEVADYVTEMKKIKHPYDKKVQARKGIEF